MSNENIEIVRRFYDAWGRESALWTLRDGRVVRYAWFHEPADALEAAGVQE